MDDDRRLSRQIEGALGIPGRRRPGPGPEALIASGVNEDLVVFTSRPSGWVAHVLLLLVLFVPPLLVILEDQEASNLIVALLWLLVLGRSFLSVLASDVEATLDVKRRTLSVANMNPLSRWLRRWGLGLAYVWEGRYDWNDLREIRVDHRVHTRALQGFQISCRTKGRRRVPIAEFEAEQTAQAVASILQGMMSSVDSEAQP